MFEIASSEAFSNNPVWEAFSENAGLDRPNLETQDFHNFTVQNHGIFPGNWTVKIRKAFIFNMLPSKPPPTRTIKIERAETLHPKNEMKVS